MYNRLKNFIFSSLLTAKRSCSSPYALNFYIMSKGFFFSLSQMEESSKMPDNHLTSAAAFVEGGIQDACDDACSICLESFCDSDPSTVCKMFM